MVITHVVRRQQRPNSVSLIVATKLSQMMNIPHVKGINASGRMMLLPNQRNELVENRKRNFMLN